MKSTAYYLGMACGIIFSVAIIAAAIYFINKKNGAKGKRSEWYDERQNIARGKAYGFGFWTLVGLMLAQAILAETGITLFSSFEGSSVLVLIAWAVVIVTCIRHDAYMALWETPKKTIKIIAVLGAANLVFGVIECCHSSPIVNGRLDSVALNLGCAIFCAVILTVFAVHQKNKTDEDAED